MGLESDDIVPYNSLVPMSVPDGVPLAVPVSVSLPLPPPSVLRALRLVFRPFSTHN